MSNGPCSIDSTAIFDFSLNLKMYLSSKFANAQSFSISVLSIFTNGSKGSH